MLNAIRCRHRVHASSRKAAELPGARDRDRQHLRKHARRVRRARGLSRCGRVAAPIEHSCQTSMWNWHHVRLQLDGTFDVVSAGRQSRSFCDPKPRQRQRCRTFSRASEDAGADAVSLVNTFLAMAIDTETRAEVSKIARAERPRDPADRVSMVTSAAGREIRDRDGRNRKSRDALESSSRRHGRQVGPALRTRLSGASSSTAWDYMRRHKIARMSDLVGSIDTSSREKQWISS